MSCDVEILKRNEITFKLTQRNGDVLTISKPCGYTEGSIDLKKIHESSVSLQTEVNDILTKLVEQEKSSNSTTVQVMEEDDEEDDDDDEDDDNDQSNGPAEKKMKT